MNSIIQVCAYAAILWFILGVIQIIFLKKWSFIEPVQWIICIVVAAAIQYIK